jgi:hypothetical protein
MNLDGARRSLFWIVLFLLLAGHLLVLSTSRLYPFTDLPNHLATATINRHYDEDANRFSDYYTIDLFPKPNVFHTLFCSAPIFRCVESANTIFFCAYAVLLPLSALLVIVKLGGNRWLALLSFLCIYNYNVTWGFVGFAFSIPVLLLLFVSAIAYLDSGSPAHLIATAFFLVSLFFIHVLTGLFALLLLALCFGFSGRRSTDRLIGLLTAAVPFAFFLVVWWTTEASGHGGEGLLDYLVDYYRADYFTTLINRMSFLYLDNAHLYAAAAGRAAGAFFSLCIIIPAAVLTMRSRAGENIDDAGRRRYAYVFLAAAAVCFLLLPAEIPQQSILYQRFSVFILLSAAVLASRLAAALRSRIAALCIFVVCAAHLALNASHVIEFNRSNLSFTEGFFPDGSSGRILSGLIYDFRYRGTPAYIHFPSYYITWSHGIATLKAVDYRFSIVRRSVPLAVLPRYLEWVGRFDDYDGRYRSVDYLLLRGGSKSTVSHDTGGFTPIGAAGEWTLYERRATKSFDNRDVSQ